MNDYYEDIMSFKGADELKKIVRKWKQLSDNIKHTKAENINILPDMLWVSGKGIDKTELLRLLSEYIFSEGNLMKFYGKVKFIEFYLGYTNSDNQNFPELNRFIETIHSASGFRSEYKGIVYIDISEWAEHFRSRFFIAFLEYIATNTNNWLVILNVDSANEKAVSELESLLPLYLRIEKIKLNLPRTKDFVDYAAEVLESFDFYLDESAKTLLKESIEKMRKSPNFGGFNAIRNLCSDIIYESLSQKADNAFFLSAEKLKNFAPGSDYVTRTISNNEKRKELIGFRG